MQIDEALDNRLEPAGVLGEMFDKRIQHYGFITGINNNAAFSLNCF